MSDQYRELFAGIREDHPDIIRKCLGQALLSQVVSEAPLINNQARKLKTKPMGAESATLSYARLVPESRHPKRYHSLAACVI